MNKYIDLEICLKIDIIENRYYLYLVLIHINDIYYNTICVYTIFACIYVVILILTKFCKY